MRFERERERVKITKKNLEIHLHFKTYCYIRKQSISLSFATLLRIKVTQQNIKCRIRKLTEMLKENFETFDYFC
jgi:hypothetical protein